MAEDWKQAGTRRQNNNWPAVADMATATCIMLVVFWIAGTWTLQRVKTHYESLQQKNERLEDENEEFRKSDQGAVIEKYKRENERLKHEISELQSEIETRVAENARLRSERDEAKRELTELRKQKPHQEPPNIVLSEGEGYTFSSLSAEVSDDLADRFRANEIDEIVSALNSPANVEIVEIVGHTDRERVPSSNNSNLDDRLLIVFEGQGKVNSLKFGSNCDLGIARAIAVKALVEDCMTALIEAGDERLTMEGLERASKLVYRTYSAAQLFPASASSKDSFDNDNPRESEDVEEDRRIEIRFTRFK